MRGVSSGRLLPLKPGDPQRVGQYLLLARLGAGGMGRVYLGRSQGGRTVAVKIVHPNFADDMRFRRRFTQEVAAARRVGGFHTAQVVDADTDADPPWLVTEYIAGPSLQEAVDEHGALPERTVAALGAGLAEGLTAIHAREVVHRDLKPGNVLLASDGPRIIDFGIARALDATSQTTRSALIGTPGYMSPEQFRGREVGPASDVFCLAAVLAFAATGRGPFGEGPGDALGYRIVNEEPDLTGVPASLLPLIAAGLEKDPDDRPGVGEFLDHYSALVDGEGLSLPQPVNTMIVTQVAETSALTGATVPDDVRENAKAPGPPPGPPQFAPPPPPQGPPYFPPSSPPPNKPAQQQAVYGVAALVGAVLLAAIVWFVVSHQDKSDASGSGDARASASQSSDEETPTPDPTGQAFAAISTGDCLNAYMDPHARDEWSEDLPRAVDCDRTDAYVRVTRVTDGTCDDKPIDGNATWSYRGTGKSVNLCLERQLRVGECFLGVNGSKKGRPAINSFGLMTSWECGKSTVPQEFNYILQVTGLTNGACPSDSYTWDFRGGNLCAKVD
ncbi:hypothetical protein Airi02_090550 [Actinoallomurus iriomotensis]|uniref:Protein kinase domain-containing protein n=1 Tax=Actinoallomurus iriomotensis TaxID=478107 RepID=A0A9W6SCK0_9ACTN|nr:hypothetical protein Airi02_090550 [Actinoallomurus iriomotensis]